MISAGLTGSASRRITEKDTALAVGSGSLPVCATPVLAAVMEAAAVDALKGALPPGETTVGISISLRHTSPTLTGRTVTARAELTEVKGAEHVRCAVAAAPFMEKAEKKYPRPAQ